MYKLKTSGIALVVSKGVSISHVRSKLGGEASYIHYITHHWSSKCELQHRNS